MRRWPNAHAHTYSHSNPDPNANAYSRSHAESDAPTRRDSKTAAIPNRYDYSQTELDSQTIAAT